MQPPTPVVPTTELIVDATIYSLNGLTEERRLGYFDVSYHVAHLLLLDHARKCR